jgi:transposase-like protein
MKPKSVDYKISAVKYYINYNVSMDDICEIFDCKKTSLKRWIHRYGKE